jgi:hypothetical protein
LVRIATAAGTRPGLPDGIFQTKNTYLGKFGWVLQWKMLLAIWYIFSDLVRCTEKNLATLSATAGLSG